MISQLLSFLRIDWTHVHCFQHAYLTLLKCRGSISYLCCHALEIITVRHQSFVVLCLRKRVTKMI